MIVNWTKSNMKVIPAHIPTALDPSSNSRFCKLAPGYNDIPDDLWCDARTFVTDDIVNGKIVEEWVKAPRPEKPEDLPLIWCELEDGRESKSIRIPAKLLDIARPGVIKRVVEGTFHPATLTKWADEESRPDVQAALQKQIKAVDAGEIVG